MNLVIADFKINLIGDAPLFMDEGYTPFLNEIRPGPADMTVECISGIPQHLFEGCETLLDAKHEEQHNISVVKYGNGLGFKLYNHHCKDEIRQLATLDESYKHWKLYGEPRTDGTLEPMKYPMGAIMLYYLAVNNNAIMIQASGIFDGYKGRLFTGTSGTGKSTMAEQWKTYGNSVINDDSLIIRKGPDGYYMHNTPMRSFNLPKSAPLNAIHFIRHFPENITRRITDAKAVSKMMDFCTQNNFDKKFKQNYVTFLSDLCESVGIYETGFVPDHSIVRYLQTHE